MVSQVAVNHIPSLYFREAMAIVNHNNPEHLALQVETRQKKTKKTITSSEFYIRLHWYMGKVSTFATCYF